MPGAATEVEPFVDTHVHFWDHGVDGLRWPWLEPGFEHPRLKGMHRIDAPQFGPAELRAEADGAAPIKVVHVQCAAPTPQPDRETAWLHEVADREGWPDAVVAPCRMRDAGAPAAIEANAAHPRFRGVRDLSVTGDVTPGEVTAALDAAAATGASVELLVPHEQFGCIEAIAERWPSVTIVLGHAGQPVERTPEYRQRWAAALGALAAHAPNVVVKISAVASGADPAWTVGSIRPWVLECIGAFGPDRAMFATNWPVDRLHGTYVEVLAAYRAITVDLSASERAAVFHGTAERVYDL